MNGTSTSETIVADQVTEAWRALLAHVDARRRELNDEVSRYPTPIAHCDDQLPKLLDQRARAVRESRLAHETDDAAGNDGHPERLRRLARFLLSSQDDDDEPGTALRRRLGRALSDALAADDVADTFGDRDWAR